MRHSNTTNYFYHFVSDRFACAIPDPNKKEVIVTGGSYTMSIVSVYTEAGWQGDLKQLTQGRVGHACSSFTQAGEKVIILIRQI